MAKVLIADDERALREALARFLRSMKMEVETVDTGTAALARLSTCDLLLTDVRMPGLDGMKLLAEARRLRPDLPIVLMTGHGSVSLAVEAMRAGAANFLTKPFHLDELEQVVRTALRMPGPPVLAQGTAAMPPVRPTGPIPGVLLGHSPAMVQLRDLIARVAPSEATVLVTGESGTGKEVVARAIHASSRRNAAPFLAVNCGAIPEALLESELFGHVKGAFTGATQSRPGLFAAAEGGTLLLDEIGELPLHLQVKLLRVLQERAYTPVGEHSSRPADVRVVAATNRDLEKMVEEGTFREDLFYRLNVLTVSVPPLRERSDDVMFLADQFLQRASLAERRGLDGFDEHAQVCLSRYSWPGNVRELEHAVTHAAVMTPGPQVTLADLPPRVRAAFSGAPTPVGVVDAEPTTPKAESTALPESGMDLRATVESFERGLIEQALSRTGGNKNKAAALLGMNRTTLVEKLKRFKTSE